jgi:transcription-repair coupling factor (superfamily II helicase)
MSVQTLLETYQQSPRLFTLADKLTFAQPQHIALKDLRGSASQFMAAAAFLHPSCSQLNHVFICNDEEDAAYFHNTLENLTQALNLFYFPASFKNRKNYRLLNSSHVMLRTEALTKFANPSGNRVGALVTYPEALFEKVVIPKAISENIIYIKTGDALEPDQLYAKLVDYGFERTDFVYQPGQFAVRGGILDIYSFGNDKPYRIELFGNDVDSIRIIDPETQLSERRLLQVSIIPNVEMQLEEAGKVSILEFFSDNTVIWIQDEELTKERLLTAEEDLQLFLQMRAESTKPKKTTTGWKNVM